MFCIMVLHFPYKQTAFKSRIPPLLSTVCKSQSSLLEVVSAGNCLIPTLACGSEEPEVLNDHNDLIRLSVYLEILVSFNTFSHTLIVY